MKPNEKNWNYEERERRHEDNESRPSYARKDEYTPSFRKRERFRPAQDSEYSSYNHGRNRNNYSQDNREGYSYRDRNFSNNGYNRNERPRKSYNRSLNENRNSYSSYSDENASPKHRPRIRINSSENEERSGDRFRTTGRPYNGSSNRGGYNPNAKYTRKKQTEYRERFIDPDEPIRLNKYLSNAGICSRREADEFIQAGVVSVNGEIVTELGVKVKRGDKVVFHDQPVKIERKVYLLLNKPKNCVTTTDDPQERMTVMNLVKNACPERIYPVGRLDRNTTGVLLLTNDGELASKLTHPKFVKKKIYQVTLDKPVTRADMEQIADGIELDDGEICADAISYVKEDVKNMVGIEIHSGRNRIVRRIFEKLGYRVYKLDRVYFAGLTKKGLSRGKYRFLTEREVNMLRMGAFE